MNTADCFAIEQGAAELEIVAPFLPRNVLIELCAGRCFDEYRRRRLDRLRQQRMRGLEIQRQMGRENAQREMRFVDGIGQHIATIEPQIYHAAELRYGKGCWKDPDFRNHTLKRSPELRVPAPAPRFIPVNGFRASTPDVDASDGASMERVGDPATGNGRALFPACNLAPTISTRSKNQ